MHDAEPERPQAIRRFGSAQARSRNVHVETIDDFDRDLVTFVLNWAPYGGPPDDELLPRFGITSDRLDDRVRDIVANGRTRNLSIGDRALLLRALAVVNLSSQAPIPGRRRRIRDGATANRRPAAVAHGTASPVGRTR